LEASGNATRPSAEEMDWKSQRKLTHLLSCHKEVNTGHYGRVDPLQNGKKKETAHMRGTGSRSTGLPTESE
jgi:hypothetical protein